MSQTKSKLRENVNQPRIKDYCETPKEQRSCSKSNKRKKPPTPPSTELQRNTKRVKLEVPIRKMADKPDGSKHENSEGPELDTDVVSALERLLQPIRDDIRDLLTTNRELKEELSENKWLRDENRKLQERVH